VRPVLDLERNKQGIPQRMVVRCMPEDRNAVKEASFGTASFSQQKGGWSIPLEPVVINRLFDFFQDLEITAQMNDYIEHLHHRQKRIISVLDVDEPLEPKDKLWDFQRASVRFLLEAKRAILGHKMGTGKTVIACSAVKQLMPKRVLIICPNNVKWYWADNMNEYGNWKNVAILNSGPASKPKVGGHKVIAGTKKGVRTENLERFVQRNESFCLIANYELVNAHLKQLEGLRPEVLIVDEAHRIKNRKAQRSQSCRKISYVCDYAWLLTGTPVRNNYDDLWSLLEVCDPVRFSGYWNFVNIHMRSVPNFFGGTDIIGLKDETSFNAMLSCYMHAKTKQEVMPDLPDKIYQDIKLPMTSSQQKIYDKMEKEFILHVQQQLDNGEEIEKILRYDSTLTQYIKLRQICLAPGILDSKGTSAKLDALKELFEEIQATGEQAVVFTFFKRFIPYIETILSDLKIDYGVIIGGSKPGHHRAVEQDLEGGRIQIVVGTIGAMGESLNLQTASTAIFCDRDWTPAVNEQAEDRIHRGEIKESPTIITLYHPNTIESDILSVCKQKKKIEKETVGRVEVLRRMLNRNN